MVFEQEWPPRAHAWPVQWNYLGRIRKCELGGGVSLWWVLACGCPSGGERTAKKVGKSLLVLKKVRASARKELHKPEKPAVYSCREEACEPEEPVG